jgi:hypothetical protein
MRRLAHNGFCEIVRGKGQTPNQYTINGQKGLKLMMDQLMDRRAAYVERGEIKDATPTKAGAKK